MPGGAGEVVAMEVGLLAVSDMAAFAGWRLLQRPCITLPSNKQGRLLHAQFTCAKLALVYLDRNRTRQQLHLSVLHVFLHPGWRQRRITALLRISIHEVTFRASDAFAVRGRAR